MTGLRPSPHRRARSEIYSGTVSFFSRSTGLLAERARPSSFVLPLDEAFTTRRLFASDGQSGDPSPLSSRSGKIYAAFSFPPPLVRRGSSEEMNLSLFFLSLMRKGRDPPFFFPALMQHESLFWPADREESVPMASLPPCQPSSFLLFLTTEESGYSFPSRREEGRTSPPFCKSVGTDLIPLPSSP